MSDINNPRLQKLLASLRYQLVPVSRRSMLKRSGAIAAAVPALVACSNQSPNLDGSSGNSGISDAEGEVPNDPNAPPAEPPPTAPAGEFRFAHGVASGDPLTDRVVLWTRVTPGDDLATVPVEWSVATDPAELGDNFTAVSNITTERDFNDYTVKIDADRLPDGTALASNTTYYYQFRVVGTDFLSPIGRTKTAPAIADAVEQVRVAVVSCSNFTFDFFNAYESIAGRDDLDLVLQLGDYLYETGGGARRSHRPDKEIVTLDEYRDRHAQYKEDTQLQMLHQQHPMISVWDDHETTNNSYDDNAANHTDGPIEEGGEGDWETRKGRAVRAYFEWMPIRPVDADGNPQPLGPDLDAPNDGPEQGAPFDGLAPDGNGRVYRNFNYGGLIDIIMLDTRLAGRVEQNGVDIVSEEQTILGAEQREWFLDQLTDSANTATWKIIGQQMNFMPLWAAPLNNWLNEDAWDGYRFDRQTVTNHLENGAPNGEQINNCVFLSGDIHATIAGDVPKENPNADGTPANPAVVYTPGVDGGALDDVPPEGSFAVEYCCNGVANVGLPIWTGLQSDTLNNPHMKYTNENDNGYLLLDITPQRVQGEWYYTVRQSTAPNDTARLDAANIMMTREGDNYMVRATAASPEKPNPPAPAPGPSST